MTRTFATLIAALTVTATLAAATVPAQAWSFGVEAPSRVTTTDLGSGRITGGSNLSGTDLGSGR